MENNGFATTIMMVLVSLKIGVAEMVTKPTVTEVVVGGSTFLNCSTDGREEIYWFHTPLWSYQERNLVFGYDQFYLPYIGRFQMENIEANGACNLVIPVVIIGDAGVYDCQVESGLGKKVSAELILLDGDLVCEPRLVTHEIIGPNICGIKPNILSCTVDYNGNKAILEWRKVRDNRPVYKGVSYGTRDNKRVVYNLTIDGNSNVKKKDSPLCSTTRSATSNDGSKLGQEEEIFKEDSNYETFKVAIIYISLCIFVAALVLLCALLLYATLEIVIVKIRIQLLFLLVFIGVHVLLLKSRCRSLGDLRSILRWTWGRTMTEVDLRTMNQELDAELQRERTEAKELKGQLRRQSYEIEKLKEKETASQIKVVHLEAKVKALEQSRSVPRQWKLMKVN